MVYHSHDLWVFFNPHYALELCHEDINGYKIRSFVIKL